MATGEMDAYLNQLGQPGMGSTGTGGDDSGSSKGLDLGIYFRMLRRNIFLILGAGLAVGTWMALPYFTAKPSFQGNFQILVEPITAQGRTVDPSAIARGQVVQEGRTIDYPTLLSVLTSPELLGQVVERVKDKYPEVTVTSFRRDMMLERFMVAQVGDVPNKTSLIQVMYQAETPQKVKDVLEAIEYVYRRFSLDDRKRRIGGGVEFIQSQLPTLQNRVSDLENQIQDLKQRYQLTNPAEDALATSEELRMVQTQRLATERELAEQTVLYNRLQRQLGFGPDTALAAASLSENPRYQELMAQIQTLEVQIAQKAARFRATSPVLRSLLEQRDNLLALLNRETSLILGSNLDLETADPRVLAFQNPLRVGLIQQLVTAATTRQVLAARRAALQQLEASLDQRVKIFPAITRRYSDLQQQLELARQTLNQFLTQRETLRIEAAQKEIPWEVVAPPELTKNPFSGKVAAIPGGGKKDLALAMAAGLIAGLGAAVLRESFRQGFACKEDVLSVTKLPGLGTIPTASIESTPMVQSLSKDGFTKSFIELFTNLRFGQGDTAKVLTVASAVSGDGKTTVALNLALTAAALGQRVLLVDADLRSPHLHEVLELDNQKGFATYLTDSPHSAIDLVQESKLEDNLFVLTTGESTTQAVRQLGAADLRSRLASLHKDYDLVIYDTANLTEYADTNFIATHTNGILLVVSLSHVKRSAVKDSVNELKRLQLPVLGVVTNEPPRRKAYASEEEPVYQEAGTSSREGTMLEGLNLLHQAPTKKKSEDVA